MNIHYSIHSRVSLNTKFTSKCEASEVHIFFCSVCPCGKVLGKRLCVSNEMQNEILKTFEFCQSIHYTSCSACHFSKLPSLLAESLLKALPFLIFSGGGYSSSATFVE